MEGISSLSRLLTILFFLFSAAILLYATKKRNGTYHLIGIAIWCIHVVVFTTVVLLCSADTLTIIGAKGLDLWLNAVLLHGGIMVFVTSLHYVSKKRLI
jgi:hypothetical protein